MLALSGSIVGAFACQAWAQQPGTAPQPSLTETDPQTSEPIAQITGVQLQPNPAGLEILLQTPAGAATLVQSYTSGGRWIAEITNAQLALPEGDRFRQDNPTEQIESVTVTPLEGNRVQVVVTGTASAPTGQVFLRQGQGLVVNIQTPAAAEPPPPQAEEEEPIELVVTAEREEEEGYYVPEASVGTRTETPLRDIPASIQVVPQQVIEDRAVTNVTEALETTSGVPGTSFAKVAEFKIRGFDGSNSFFVNGSRRGGFGFDNPTTDNIERIEVLKGPSSVLFGQGSPGGIVNLITKRPLEDPYYNLNFQAGSFERIRPSFDISGPLISDSDLLYRLIGSYTRARSFVEFANSEIYFLAPSLEWRIGPDTTLAFDLEFIDSSITSICGIPAIGRGVADIPRSRALCESGDFGDSFNKFDIQRYNITTRFNHQFSQAWSLRNTLFFRTNFLRRAAPNPLGFNEVTGETQRRIFTSDDSFNNLSNNLDIVGDFTTGSIEHRLLAGLEYTRENVFRRLFVGGNYPSINIFDPVYSDERFRFDSFPFSIQRDQPSTTYGFYLQDQISFTDDLILVLGGRYDILEQKSINLITDVSSEQTFNVFSPRVGLVYRPVEPLSLYASFTQGFEPSNAILADGSAPPPQRATQYEVGAKFGWGGLAATLAYFDITKTNIPTPDPDPNNQGFSVITGEVKSRGVELDITGEILPGWNIIAAYAYTDAFVSQDNSR